MPNKATLKLAGVELAGNEGFTWRFVTGTQPYRTTALVHKTIFDRSLKSKIGEPLTLEIVPFNGKKVSVKDVYIIEEMPSDSKNRVRIMLADMRWRWERMFVSRDYNIPKKSGNKTRLHGSVPIENKVTVDVYDFKVYSLDNQEKWVPKRIIEDIMTQVEPDGKWWISSMPYAEGEGGMVIQNVMIRDGAGAAIGRALSYMPGLEVYVDVSGSANFFDATTLKDTKEYRDKLPPPLRSGDWPVKVDRKKIRPGRVKVHYQREVECLFEFEDDWAGSTSANRQVGEPFLENVIPTVDPETELTRWHAELGIEVTDTVDAGTWVDAYKWLEAMDDDANKPPGSLPWTWETIKRHWFTGDLEGHLTGSAERGVGDIDPNGNIALRVQTLRQHFRQTFRINQKYMDRIRSLEAVRVTPFDPVTASRPYAPVWSQAVIVSTTKGLRVRTRKDPAKQHYYKQIDEVPGTGENVMQKSPVPARVQIIDRDQGIFRVDWLLDPYGMNKAIVPCHLVNFSGQKTAPSAALRDMDSVPIAVGLTDETATNVIFLADEFKLKALLTIVPAAPNNKSQFHIEEVRPSDLDELLTEQGAEAIKGGDGPDAEVYIPPGEVTARHAWGDNDEIAKDEVALMLGVDSDSKDAGLFPGQRELRGFTWVNGERDIEPHAKAVAVEALMPFADTYAGQVVTRSPDQTVEIKGNVSSASVQVSSSPAATVRVVHDFSGRPQPLSRFALLPDEARRHILGEIPFTRGDR